MTQTHVIVGAGQAGGHAAAALRQAGFAGRIVLVGQEPEPPYERPPLSKAMLTDVPEPPPAWLFDPARYAALGIELLLGTPAVALDAAARTLALADGRVLGWDRLLLATGGQARRLDLPGGVHVRTLRTLDDARALRAALRPGARVACIGAGVIGLEVASSARALGCAVTVIEAAAGVMGRALTPELAGWLAALHRARGVELLLAARVARVEPGAVLLEGGARVPADLVVAGIGLDRAQDLAVQAGLETDHGIVVDAHTRTSDPAIHAAGDVAAFWHPVLGRRLRLESWRHAQNHGIAAGRAMAGLSEPYDEVPWFWTDQHGRHIQVAGLPADAARTILRGHPGDAPFAAFHLDSQGCVVAVTGVDSPRDVRAGQALIRARAAIDPALLADPARRLQDLARAAA